MRIEIIPTTNESAYCEDLKRYLFSSSSNRQRVSVDIFYKHHRMYNYDLGTTIWIVVVEIDEFKNVAKRFYMFTKRASRNPPGGRCSYIYFMIHK